jgi:polysaccharide biosynthesis/export protein
MRPSRLVVFVLALIALAAAGCARHPPMAPQADIVASAPLAMAPEEAPYSLDSGDRLRVVVFGQEGLSAIYAVDASGNITMPLIGAVHARGTSPASLSRTIADKLRQGYIREPHVAVEIEAYRPFFILGEVTTPGQYAYVPNMSVENAVAIAGGFTPRAQRRTIVLSRTIDGIPVRGPVPADTPVRPGDTIVVQERWF